MEHKRVVITGVGPVSAIGIGREAFTAAVCENRSGIGDITAFDCARYRSRRAAELQEFHVEDYLESSKTYLDRASEIAFAAMSLAIENAQLDLATIDRNAAGLMYGSAFGSQETTTLFFQGFLEKGPRFVKPVLFPNTYSNTAISLLAIEYRIAGIHLNFAAGGTASGNALLAAYDRIRQGREVLIFAGGGEAFCETIFAGYAGLGQLSPGTDGGAETCAPFDCRRNGFILGEGGAMFVLEDREHARARHAPILAEIRGAGISGDGIGDAMRQALAQAGMVAAALGLIVAAANGSFTLDVDEALALRDLFGPAAASVPVTSFQPMLGETLGAASALGTAAALSCLETGFVPGILNLCEPATNGNVDLVRAPGRAGPVRSAMINAVDPGGSAVSLVLAQP